ncbi:MAG: hypothetical protein ACPKQO_11330 [Nitrososphaeraceae archaeon]
MYKIKKIAYVAVFAVVISTLITGNSNYSYAHMFTNDESASFMALVDQIKVQGKEIRNHLLNNDGDIASKHYQKIVDLYTDDIDNEIKEKNERISNELSTIFIKLDTHIQESDIADIDFTVQELNDILDEALSVRIETDMMNNSTVQALHFANIINAIDLNYADIFDRKPMNMSNMMMNDSKHSAMQMDENMTDVNSASISNPESLHTVKGLLDVATVIFETELKNVTDDKKEFITKAEEGLAQLKEIAESELPYDEAMKIIHGIIHPNLQDAYNLKLNGNMMNDKSMSHGDMMNNKNQSHESMNNMKM